MSFFSLKKYINFILAITDVHPQNLWELVADPKGPAEHTLGTTGIEQ
jgi:hypothetical protein